MQNTRTIKKIQQLEKQLADTCHKIYKLSIGGRTIIPRHPYVLVRVLPKEHKTEGGIWLAEKQQVKSVYEGIVLSVWKPYVEERVVECKECEDGNAIQFIRHICDLKIGDRIAFAHYEGLPVGDWLDDRYYRLIREGTDQNKNPYCSVLGTLEYTGDAVMKAKLRALMQEIGSITVSGFGHDVGEAK